MKKSILFLSVFLGLSALLIYSSHTFPKMKESNISAQTAAGKHLDDPKDLDKKLHSKENVFVYFYSPECSVCEETTPFLINLADQMKIELEELNVSEFGKEMDRYNIEYTPTLVYYGKGREVDRLEGGYRIVNGKPDPASEQTFRDFFNKYKGK